MAKTSSMVYKTLVVGVIVLFIGIGIQPAFAVTPNTTDSKDDCKLCPKVSSLHLFRLKRLLNRLEKYDNELSVLSKLNPEIEEKYQEISNYINTDKPISIRPLCIILEILMDTFAVLGEYFVGQLDSWIFGESLLYYIIPIIACFSIAIMFQLVGVGILCWKII